MKGLTAKYTLMAYLMPPPQHLRILYSHETSPGVVKKADYREGVRNSSYPFQRIYAGSLATGTEGAPPATSLIST